MMYAAGNWITRKHGNRHTSVLPCTVLPRCQHALSRREARDLRVWTTGVSQQMLLGENGYAQLFPTQLSYVKLTDSSRALSINIFFLSASSLATVPDHPRLDLLPAVAVTVFHPIEHFSEWSSPLKSSSSRDQVVFCWGRFMAQQTLDEWMWRHTVRLLQLIFGTQPCGSTFRQNGQFNISQTGSRINRQARWIQPTSSGGIRARLTFPEWHSGESSHLISVF